MSNLYFRKADINDLELTFMWSNDEETRKNSFSMKPISMEEHIEWFKNKINSNKSRIYIYMDENIPIGILRLDLDDEICYLSYSIDKKHRGKGYGKKMIREIDEIIKNDNTLSNDLKAEVKFENTASQKIFEQLNYKIYKKSDKLEYSKTVGR